jgi:hypothetical protein
MRLDAAARVVVGSVGGWDFRRWWRVEGSIHQAVTVTGTRQARYRGLAKTHLEHVFSAVALNLIRLNNFWAGTPLERGRTSHLERLNYALAA